MLKYLKDDGDYVMDKLLLTNSPLQRKAWEPLKLDIYSWNDHYECGLI